MVTRRRIADNFSTFPAADFQLLAVLRAAAADRPPAAAVAGRAVPAADPLLAVPVATHIAAAPTARAAHHAGHAAADAAPAARGHVQSHTLRVRGKSITYLLPHKIYIRTSRGGNPKRVYYFIGNTDFSGEAIFCISICIISEAPALTSSKFKKSIFYVNFLTRLVAFGSSLT